MPFTTASWGIVALPPTVVHARREARARRPDPSRSPMSAVGVAGLEGRSAMASHPLEPLSADEFRRTAEILRRDGHVTDTFRFASIELLEPAKQEVLAWRVGDAGTAALVRGGVEPLGQQDVRSDRRPHRRCRPFDQAHSRRHAELHRRRVPRGQRRRFAGTRTSSPNCASAASPT